MPAAHRCRRAAIFRCSFFLMRAAARYAMPLRYLRCCPPVAAGTTCAAVYASRCRATTAEDTGAPCQRLPRRRAATRRQLRLTPVDIDAAPCRAMAPLPLPPRRLGLKMVLRLAAPRHAAPRHAASAAAATQMLMPRRHSAHEPERRVMPELCRIIHASRCRDLRGRAIFDTTPLRQRHYALQGRRRHAAAAA